jgi:hypothetical protein
MDVTKTRLQVASQTALAGHKPTFTTVFRDILKTDGIPGLYAGLVCSTHYMSAPWACHQRVVPHMQYFCIAHAASSLWDSPTWTSQGILREDQGISRRYADFWVQYSRSCDVIDGIRAFVCRKHFSPWLGCIIYDRWCSRFYCGHTV